jgi:hypothetical protein
MDSLFGWFFGPSTASSSGPPSKYSERRGAPAACSGRSHCRLRRPALHTGLALQEDPHRLCTPQDKQYLVAFAQLAGRRLARAHRRGHPAHDRDRAQAPRAWNAVAFPGLSINGFTNAPNSGILFVTAEALRGAPRPRPSPARHRQQLQARVRGHPGRLHRHLPAAARAGPGHHRRLQALRRGPRRQRTSTRSTRHPEPDRQGEPDAGASRASSPASRSTRRSSTPTSTA